MLRIALFGLPGAGKGTQAELLSKHYNIPHVSTGDIFRSLLKTNSDLANEIKKVIDSGKLVSDDLVTKVAFSRLSAPDCKKGFILDGYPRTLNQAQALCDSEHAISRLILIDLPKEEIISRLSGRRVCSSCSSTFHISFLKDSAKCPECGGVLLQREDDKPASIETRLSEFNKNINEVISFFERKSLLLRINGNQSQEQVFDDIVVSLKEGNV